MREQNNRLLRIGSTELAKPICVSVAEIGDRNTKNNVYLLVNRRMSTLMNREDMIDFTREIVEFFDGETPKDVDDFLRSVHRGDYGQTFGKITCPTLFVWWGEYLDKKAEEREQEQAKNKGDLNPKGFNVFSVTNEKGETLAEVLKATPREVPKVRSESITFEQTLSFLKENIQDFSDEELIIERGRMLLNHYGLEPMLDVINAEIERRGL